MKKYLICILFTGIIAISVIPIRAEEPTTTITIGITEEKVSDQINSIITITNRMGVPLPNAVIFIESNGMYYAAGKTDENGICKLYLIPNQNSNMIIRKEGFSENVLTLYHEGDDEQSYVIEMDRKGDYDILNEDNITLANINVELEYFTSDQLSFNLSNTGMDNANPEEGDVRFVPEYWYVENHTTQTQSDITYFMNDEEIKPMNATQEKNRISTQIPLSDDTQLPLYAGDMTLEEEGNYTLYVIFTKEQYHKNEWIIVNQKVIKQVDFYVKEKQATPDEPKPNPTPKPSVDNGENGDTKNDVSTGDETKIELILFILLTALMVMMYTNIRKNRKNR